MRDETAAPHRDLTPANENPWYVLMTLYGEQEGEEIDWELHEKNRRAWNAWAATSTLSNWDEKEFLGEASNKLGVEKSELDPRRWFVGYLHPQSHEGSKVERQFQAVLRSRWGEEKPDLKLPSAEEVPDFSSTHFEKPFVAKKMLLTRGADFTCAVFGCHVEMERCLFGKVTSFSSAVFRETVTLSGANFWGQVGFVAQIGLRSGFPLPRTDLPYGLCLGYAKRCEAV